MFKVSSKSYFFKRTLNYRILVLICLLIISIITTTEGGRYRKTIIKYPQGTLFWATDFFVKGCRNFVDNCPAAYKIQQICARSYNGEYKNFGNYCEMQYVNCNTWRNWRVFKRDRC